MRGLVLILLSSSAFAQSIPTPLAEAWKLEKDGDAAAARQTLRTAVQKSNDPSLLKGYAEFLDRRHDPVARDIYRRALDAKPQDSKSAAAMVHRLVVLDLLSGDSKAAAADSSKYRELSPNPITLPAAVAEKAVPMATINIPGPLRSFSRMAALSPETTNNEVLPMLARNIVTSGYQASNSAEGLEPTEYLKLINRYLGQARELDKLAGTDKKLKIDACDSTQANDLLRVLGYRIRGGCGSDVVLETVNATRAFLTIDSGFPLAELEQALRANRPFIYDYSPAVVPVLHTSEYWMEGKDKAEFIDTLISDPSLCRLYLGFSRLDDETAAELKKAVPAQRLRAFAHVLDFYGGMFEIRNGKAVVPGGPTAAAAWSQLAGKSPDEGAAFFERLLTRDDGWLASYYDALARMNGRSRDYLLDSKRLQRFYVAIKGRLTTPGPARPVFRANTDMLLLTQKLRIEADGRPHVPGSLEIWKTLFSKHPHGRFDVKNMKAPATWKEPDDLVEALLAMTRRVVENEPLKFYMAMSDLNRFRSKPLEPATVERLAAEFKPLNSQFAIFNETPSISDATIIAYLDAANWTSKIRDNLTRANMAGSLQSLVSLWQIMVRQGSIRDADADATLASIIKPFEGVKENPDLFQASRKGVETLLAVSKAPTTLSAQDRMIDLMSGTIDYSGDTEAHNQMVQDMMQIFEAQKLISLDSILAVADHLDAVARGEKLNAALLNKFNSRVAEIQQPRASLSAIEKNTLTFGYWTEKHIEFERKINLRAAAEKANGDKVKLSDVKGLLAPFLRDTLVGFNYMHYAPPGAQVLHTNPLFVRMHDFIGIAASNQTWKMTEIYGSGWPANAGGRLVGSMSNLPYALAEAEQNFLIPSREQALIWGDLVPQMIISAKVPRWWQVTPAQLSWVNLHMNLGESLLGESVISEATRKAMIPMLASHTSPARVRRIEMALDRGDARAASLEVTPSETYLLAADWMTAHNDDSSELASAIRQLQKDSPMQVSSLAISRAFGTPKPTLAHSYAPELMNLRTFPTLMGYSSRIMAESWESNNLYYAALANDLDMRPTQLNVMVPQWTQSTVEGIFATHLEDWPALLRSLRLVGDGARNRAREAEKTDTKASLD